MSLLGFIQRLAALMPRPRLHLIRFHGVLSPNAKLRSLVVPQGLPKDEEVPGVGASGVQCQAQTAQVRPARISCTRLLKRVFDIDMQHCPHCRLAMDAGCGYPAAWVALRAVSATAMVSIRVDPETWSGPPRRERSKTFQPGSREPADAQTRVLRPAAGSAGSFFRPIHGASCGVWKSPHVFKRVRLNVRKHSKGRQIPWESTSLEDDFVFNAGVPVAESKLVRAMLNQCYSRFANVIGAHDRTDADRCPTVRLAEDPEHPT